MDEDLLHKGTLHEDVFQLFNSDKLALCQFYDVLQTIDDLDPSVDHLTDVTGVKPTVSEGRLIGIRVTIVAFCHTRGPNTDFATWIRLIRCQVAQFRNTFKLQLNLGSLVTVDGDTTRLGAGISLHHSTGEGISQELEHSRAGRRPTGDQRTYTVSEHVREPCPYPGLGHVQWLCAYQRILCLSRGRRDRWRVCIRELGGGGGHGSDKRLSADLSTGLRGTGGWIEHWWDLCCLQTTELAIQLLLVLTVDDVVDARHRREDGHTYVPELGEEIVEAAVEQEDPSTQREHAQHCATFAVRQRMEAAVGGVATDLTYRAVHQILVADTIALDHSLRHSGGSRGVGDRHHVLGSRWTRMQLSRMGSSQCYRFTKPDYLCMCLRSSSSRRRRRSTSRRRRRRRRSRRRSRSRRHRRSTRNR
mmetsp:Transcript_34664/g.87146  ORF Transcript_34664/g.87146 Transcript_34664/m.87146 type:complete len:417 (-) Transcript_34664:141-1391(-)